MSDLFKKRAAPVRPLSLVSMLPSAECSGREPSKGCSHRRSVMPTCRDLSYQRSRLSSRVRVLRDRDFWAWTDSFSYRERQPCASDTKCHKQVHARGCRVRRDTCKMKNRATVYPVTRVYRVPALEPIIGRWAVPDVDQPARLPRRSPAYSREAECPLFECVHQ